MAAQKDNIKVYTPVNNPDGLRKHVLLTAIDSLTAIKSIEKYSAEQEEKKALQAEFRKISNRIKLLTGKLQKEYIPQIKEPVRLEKKLNQKKSVVVKAKTNAAVKSAAKQRAAVNKFDSEIGKLKDLVNSL